MSLSDNDKRVLRATWDKIQKDADAIGADALGRLLEVYPQTKTYFSHWPELTYGSKNVKEHGATVMSGFRLAVEKVDNMNAGLLELSEKHAFSLRVDPTNFKLLAHCIHVAVAVKFPAEFTAEVHLVMDKFLCNLALALAEKYR